MIQIFKKFILKILNPVLYRLGYERQQRSLYNKNSLLTTLFESLKEMGFEPKHIVDIGANHGTWTREVLIHFPDAFYTLVEPQNWLQPSFQDLLDTNKKIRYYPVGAGKENGSFNFTIVERDDSCTFKYTEEEAKANGYRQIEIPIITLNDIIKEQTDRPLPDIVKIDAEGLDIEVLEGANDLLGKTEVFMVEAAVFSKNFDNNAQKMISYMDEKGYVLFDITDLNRPFIPRVLWLIELVFVKRGGVLDRFIINI